MAGDFGQIKRRKTFPQILSTKHNLVFEATNHLEENLLNCFVLLKIKNSNASSSANFSSTCFLEFVRSCDASEEPADKRYELYYFSDIFVRGIEILKDFLQEQKIPEEKGECIALENLINVINNQEDIAKKLANFLDCTKEEYSGQGGSLWSIELAHHLLKELAVNQSYVIDQNSRNKVEKCFCGEKINGQVGDCSIGNTEVWHGMVDILLGHSQDVAVTIVTDEDEDCAKSDRSSAETKYDGDLKSHYTQIIAETTVFALVQKIHNPQFDNYLIPTIAISKSHVIIFMYDPEHDILIESSEFKLMNYVEGQHMIPYRTILALWLTINYKYFCTGITETMKSRGFTADFFKNVAENKKRLYLEDLKIGGSRAPGKMYPSDYLLNQVINAPMFAVRSKPYKP